HTCNLPLFFQGDELKLAMLTPNNMPIWQYWHDERNQQVFGSLFNSQRMSMLMRPGLKGASNVIYAFTHEHEGKNFFYSMLMQKKKINKKKYNTTLINHSIFNSSAHIVSLPTDIPQHHNEYLLLNSSHIFHAHL
ncbi:hypothetical protein QO228_23100, partial [Vibrio vulnificus]|nr:hypothetical protein [Vibrio vulnificus]